MSASEYHRQASRQFQRLPIRGFRHGGESTFEKLWWMNQQTIWDLEVLVGEFPWINMYWKQMASFFSRIRNLRQIHSRDTLCSWQYHWQYFRIRILLIIFRYIHPSSFNLQKLLEAGNEKVFKQARLSFSPFLLHLSTTTSTTDRQQPQPIKMSGNNSDNGDHVMSSDSEALSSVSLFCLSVFDLQGVELLRHVLSTLPPQLARHLSKTYTDYQ